MSRTNLKKTLLLFVVSCGLALAAQAQTTAAPARPAHPRPTPEQRVEKMAQELNLSAAQKSQFLQLEQEHRTKMEALRNSNGTDQRTQAEAARTAHRQAQRALLTPEQAVKFDARAQEHRGKGPGKGKGQCAGKTKKA